MVIRFDSSASFALETHLAKWTDERKMVLNNLPSPRFRQRKFDYIMREMRKWNWDGNENTQFESEWVDWKQAVNICLNNIHEPVRDSLITQ
jgi:hypothetical protein